MIIHIGQKFYHPQPPGHVKVMQGHRLTIFMLNFYVKVFRISLLLKYMMDLVPIWYHARYWSKVFNSTIILKMLKVFV